MENASQALIIAGAILLAILLIAIGMFIFNKANTSIQDAAKGMDQNAIAVVNGKFTPYGGRISGTQLKALLGIWGQYHAQLEADGADDVKFIKANITGVTTAFKDANKPSSSELLTLTNNVKDLTSFDVTFGFTSALITQINVASAAKP